MQEIEIVIRNRHAVAASNVSMARNLLSTHWILLILENYIEIEGGVDSKSWTKVMIPLGEAIGTLDFTQYIISRSKNIKSGKVVVLIDNKTILKEIYKLINKESNIMLEVGVTIATIQDLINNVTIDISIEYANNKAKPEKSFNNNLNQY